MNTRCSCGAGLAGLFPAASSRGGLAGIALSSAGGGGALAAVDPAVWAWLDRRKWLISQNNSKDGWLTWLPVLRQTPTLRLLVAHCGLPG